MEFVEDLLQVMRKPNRRDGVGKFPKVGLFNQYGLRLFGIYPCNLVNY